jgi:hypothetical protein
MKYLLSLLLLVAGTAMAQEELRSLKDIDRFFCKSTLAPQNAIDSGYSGFVVARFSVAGGKVTSPEIVFSDHAVFNDVVINAINRSSGKWGTEMKSDYLIPFYFSTVSIDKWQTHMAPPLPSFPALNRRRTVLVKPVMCTTFYIACNFYGPASECKSDGVAY